MRIEEILFWFFISLGIILLAWKLFGSPETEVILTVLIGSHVALWREFGVLRSRIARMDEKLDLIWNEFKKQKEL